jgi:hypothetical protein
MKKTILHITVGGKDFEPTQEDLSKLHNYFREVQQDEINRVGIIVTRHDIKIKVVEIQSSDEIQVVSAIVEKPIFRVYSHFEDIFRILINDLDKAENYLDILEKTNPSKFYEFVAFVHYGKFPPSSATNVIVSSLRKIKENMYIEYEDTNL